MNQAVRQISPPVFDDVWIAKQPILNPSGRVIAHELLFRKGAVEAATVDDDHYSTLSVIERAIDSIGMRGLAGHTDCFLNCSKPFLTSPTVKLLPASKFVLEVLETCPLDEELYEACVELKDAGFRIALDDIVKIRPEIVDFLPVVDIVKIDWINVPASHHEELVSFFRAQGKQILAEKVEDQSALDEAIHAGCDLVQGYFFCRPELLSGKRVPPHIGSLLTVVDLLLAEARLDRIARELQRSPMLAGQLIRLANCAMLPRTKTVSIESIHQALAIAGTDRLLQWCSLLLYIGNLPFDENPLVHQALERADFIVRQLSIVLPHDRRLHTKGRLTGLLSLLHVAHGQEAGIFWSEVDLAQDVRDAIVSHSGILGQALYAAQRMEQS